MKKFKVGTKYINKSGLTLKITKFDKKTQWYYFIEMGMQGVASQKELEQIIKEMEYLEVK